MDATSAALFRRRLRFVLIPVIVLGLVTTGALAAKTYRAFTVLQSARALDLPEAGSIRAWMTVDYVATTFAVPAAEVLKGIDLPMDTNPRRSLRVLADAAGLDPLVLVQRVQAVLAEARAAVATPPVEEPSEGWIAHLTDAILSAFLVYGYVVFAAVLFLGALGLPVPAGPLTAVAGTLALQGEMSAGVIVVLGVAMSVAGDLAGYGGGRVLSPNFLERWGRWVGYTPSNRLRLERLFARWGALTLVLTRSLVAYIGIVASILAGVGRYDLKRFIVYSVAGRALWTGAYFGLGYAVGTDFEAASGFLARLSLLLLALAATVGAGAWLVRLGSRNQGA